MAAEAEDSLAVRDVPDTTCRKTTGGGKHSWEGFRGILIKFGFRPRRVATNSEFRFGNAGILVSEEVNLTCEQKLLEKGL